MSALSDREMALTSAAFQVKRIEDALGPGSDEAREARGALRTMGEAPEGSTAFYGAEGRLEGLVRKAEHLDGRDEYAEKLPADLEPSKPDARAFTLAGLNAHEFPLRKAIVCRGESAILRAGHLAQVAAGRGIGKTWLLQTLALVAAGQVEALELRAAEPSRVLYIDGEMSSEEIKARFERLCGIFNVSTKGLPLTVLAADWQEDYLPRLDTAEGQDFVERHVEAADFVILDNRSCLFDPDGEKDAGAWQSAQDWLLSLRRRGKAVVVAHHANRQGSARGHSKAEDLLNLSIRLTRPEGYEQDQGARFLVEFDKARGVHGPAVAPFVACLNEHGWTIQSVQSVEGAGVKEKLREYLQATDGVGERPTSATAAVRGAGVRKQEGLRAWREMQDAGEILLHGGGGYALA